MFVNFRNDPLCMDALEVILQLVQLVYRIRHQISVVFNIAGPLLSRERSCSGGKKTPSFLCFRCSAELTNNIKNPRRNNNCRSWKYSEQQLQKVLKFDIRAIEKPSLKFFFPVITYSAAFSILSLWLLLLLKGLLYLHSFYQLAFIQILLFNCLFFLPFTSTLFLCCLSTSLHAHYLRQCL